jgi:hypothetical protein
MCDLCGVGVFAGAVEIAVHAGGVEGKIEGFADVQQHGAAGEAVLRVFRECGIDVVFDDLMAGGDLALLTGEIDAFAEVVQDEGAPWVFLADWGFHARGLGFGCAGRRRRRGEDAGGEAGFQNDRLADGVGEAEEDEARVGPPGAGSLGRLRGLIRKRLLGGEAGEVHAELGEFLEDLQVAEVEFGGLLRRGRGLDCVQGSRSDVFGSEVEHNSLGLASFLVTAMLPPHP